MASSTTNSSSSSKTTYSFGNTALHTARTSWPYWRRSIAIGVAIILTFVLSAAGLAYVQLSNKLENLEVEKLLGRTSTNNSIPTDLSAGKPLNILILGSDSRAGADNIDGSAEETTGARSDTTMVVHISADRSFVNVVSIPRDLLVNRPICLLSDGTEEPAGEDVMFNTAFAMGGNHNDIPAAAACSIKTVEALGEINIDGFVVVDFQGLMRLTEALGGVPVYIPQDVDDPYTGLKLTQGCHVLNGTEALSWARARYNIGDGSDISRISRQQELVSAIAREGLRAGMLTNPPQLYSFLSAVLESIKTGQALSSLNAITGLALSLRNLDLNNLHLLTLPNVPDGNRVRVAPGAERIWSAFRRDLPLAGDVNGSGQSPANTGDSVLNAALLYQDKTLSPTSSLNSDLSSKLDTQATPNTEVPPTANPQPSTNKSPDGSQAGPPPICHK